MNVTAPSHPGVALAATVALLMADTRAFTDEETECVRAEIVTAIEGLPMTAGGFANWEKAAIAVTLTIARARCPLAVAGIKKQQFICLYDDVYHDLR